MKVKIKRQDRPDSTPYWNTFNYDKPGKVTVAAVLDYINHNDDPIDENGNLCRRIKWECGCMQRMCGGCAMVINKTPALACNTFVNPEEAESLTIEPLTKFKVICDLMVDRSCIGEFLKNAEAYRGEYSKGKASEHRYQYQAAKCLKCGLCLEVCPNFTSSSAERGSFYGAVLANEAYLLHSSSADRRKEIKQGYRKHFERGCSRSLACRDICPMKIPTLSSIGYMNRII